MSVLTGSDSIVLVGDAELIGQMLSDGPGGPMSEPDDFYFQV